MTQCDALIADPAGYEKLQVQAMETLIRAIKVCYGLILDVEVEMLEQEVKELKRREAELNAASSSLGYTLPDTTQ